MTRIGAVLLAGHLALWPASAGAAAPAMTRADYEACQARDETGFEQAIAKLTEKTLQAGVARVDFPAVVAAEWRRTDMDELIDKRVDLAVAEVRSQTAWSELLQSLAYREKAQQLASAVAERVYRSDAVKVAIEGLATGVGKGVSGAIEVATIDAAEPAQLCLQAFLGPRYGATVARSVTATAKSAFLVDPAKAAAPVSPGSVLLESSEGISGAVVLLVRRQLAGMASRVGQRIVGSVLSRLVSVVAGGVGVVLIAKDIWDLRYGVMPIIADEMKSRASKDAVQSELAQALEQQVADGVREIAQGTAGRVVEIWRQFRQAHAKVLALAESDGAFRRFLDAVPPARLARLDEVVALVLARDGETGVRSRIENGTLQRAVGELNDQGMTIARETGSVDAALKWHAVAQGRLAGVVEHAIHQRSSPDDFTGASLARLLAVDDRVAIGRLAGLGREARATLFELEPARLKDLARSLTEAELATLARYLTGLAKAPRERMLRAVAERPARMQLIATEQVRDAILLSRDQDAAIDMMLREGRLLDIEAVRSDIDNVLAGRVHPLLLWIRHPVAIAGLAAGLLIIVLVILRIVLSGRNARRHTGRA